MRCRAKDCHEEVADDYGPLLCTHHRTEALEARIRHEQAKLARRAARPDWMRQQEHENAMRDDEEQIRREVADSWQMDRGNR